MVFEKKKHDNGHYEELRKIMSEQLEIHYDISNK